MTKKENNIEELNRRLNYLISNNIPRESMSPELIKIIKRRNIEIFLDAIFNNEEENVNENE